MRLPRHPAPVSSTSLGIGIQLIMSCSERQPVRHRRPATRQPPHQAEGRVRQRREREPALLVDLRSAAAACPRRASRPRRPGRHHLPVQARAGDLHVHGRVAEGEGQLADRGPVRPARPGERPTGRPRSRRPAPRARRRSTATRRSPCPASTNRAGTSRCSASASRSRASSSSSSSHQPVIAAPRRGTPPAARCAAVSPGSGPGSDRARRPGRRGSRRSARTAAAGR